MRRTSLVLSFALAAVSGTALATKPVTTGSVGISRSTRAGSTWVDTTTSMPSSKVLVTRYTESSYSKGAAHPIFSVRTINYDMTTGKNLRLGNLFKPGYLKAMSKSAIGQLKTSMPDGDAKWMRDGAGPTAGNFSAFSITQKGIQVDFGDYQVGPHAVGAQSVLVPYSTLKPFMKSGTVIAGHK